MKTIQIALKDLTRSFRSAFLLAFMFAIPLLMTGLFYLMFGNTAAQDSSASLPKTQVVVANLDQGSPLVAEGLASQPGAGGARSLGEALLASLQSPALADLLEVSLAPDAAAARKAVDDRQAGVAVIIPLDFSAAFADPQASASLELYQDPTLTVGPGIVRSVLDRAATSFSGVKIAVNVALAQAQTAGAQSSGRSLDPAAINAVAQQAAAWTAAQDGSALAEVRSPQARQAPANLLTNIIGPIMGGMLIMFAFFTGGATAQTLLKEQEEGTLARLFTTPTRLSSILGGKFIAVGLTVVVQVIVLLVAARFIFGIQWGDLPSVALTAVGIVACATSFGIFLTSLVQSTRQSGMIFGGLVTITGMLGMMRIFTGAQPGGSTAFDLVSLFVPQGWAMRGLLMGIRGAAVGDAALNLLVLLGWSLVFFSIGLLRFQKRFV